MTTERPDRTREHVVPFVLYLFATLLISRFEGEAYMWGYTAVVIALGGFMIALLRGKQLFRIHARVGTGVAVGLIGIALWIVLSELHLEAALTSWLPAWVRPSPRVSFDPFAGLDSQWKVVFFIVSRLAGIAMIVPIAEELFWRSFLLRWSIDPDWERVPLGKFTYQSCLVVTAMFTLAHPEWFAAATYCLLLNGLLYWKRDLWLCIVAHATSNFALVMYVLYFKAYWLW